MAASTRLPAARTLRRHRRWSCEIGGPDVDLGIAHPAVSGLRPRRYLARAAEPRSRADDRGGNGAPSGDGSSSALHRRRERARLDVSGAPASDQAIGAGHRIANRLCRSRAVCRRRSLARVLSSPPGHAQRSGRGDPVPLRIPRGRHRNGAVQRRPTTSHRGYAQRTARRIIRGMRRAAELRGTSDRQTGRT